MKKKWFVKVGVLFFVGIACLVVFSGPVRDFFFEDTEKLKSTASETADTKSKDRGLGGGERGIDGRSDSSGEVDPSLAGDGEIEIPAVGNVGGEAEVPPELRDALAALSETESGSGEDAELTRSISSKWAAINLADAVEWAFQLPNGLARIALSEISRTAEPNTLPELFKILNEAGSDTQGNVKGYGLAATMQKWSGVAPQEAWDAASEIRDDFTRAMIYSDMTMQTAQTDPKAAAENLLSVVARFPEGSEERALLDPAFGMVAESFAGESLQTSIDWVESLAEGRAKEEAVKGLTHEYFKQDPALASEWLTGLPDGRSRDLGIMNLIIGTRDDVPATRMAWALSMTGGELKENMVLQVGESWKMNDEAGLRTWLETPEGKAMDVRLRNVLLEDGEQ